MRTLEKFRRFHADLRRASNFYHVALPIAWLRSLNLFFIHQFSRKEIIGYGLFVPAVTAKMPVLISKERSLGKLAAINPPRYQNMTESKDEFHKICAARGLPLPCTYGWTANGQEYDGEGNPFSSDQAWREYLSERLPEEFIIKDRDGAYGSGFCAFRRVRDSFQRVDTASVCDINGLLAYLSQVGGDSGIIIQKRLYDRTPLAALSGRPGLQTMRINTLLYPDGQVAILFYMIKILAGQTVSDNFSMGTTGNLIAYGDRDRGVLRGAVNIHECGSGMRDVAVHPDTGIRFDGFELPGWTDAIELAKTGQRCFPQLPSLGWDIALTEHGPVIIEANSRWDPPLYAPFLMSAENWRRIFGTGDHDPWHAPR